MHLGSVQCAMTDASTRTKVPYAADWYRLSLLVMSHSYYANLMMQAQQPAALHGRFKMARAGRVITTCAFHGLYSSAQATGVGERA